MAAKSEESLNDTGANTESMPFDAEIGKVLQLMIHSLYTNRDIFLRELISNASDACDKLRYEALTAPELLGEAPTLQMHITVDKEAQTITIADSGIGMSREELIAHLGTIAKSGTQEFLARLSADQSKDRALIGQFGVGFYSAFMVAEEVKVRSRRAGSEEAWQWQSDGRGTFRITRCEASVPRGTEITLHVKPEAAEYLDSFRLRHIIETYSNHISFPILLAHDGMEDQVNSGSALWIRPKSEITETQYHEFYHHVAHAPDTPWMVLHNKNEGKIEYSNLLFIPSVKPFDLYHPDRKKRVKLYVKRVYITEENVEVVPAYMRFLRGVIDSEDLPLNISRETLQTNPQLAQIKESVVRRVLSELRKKAASDEDGYRLFWNHFGPVLKEGLCESHSPREALLEVSRFSTTLEENVSLDRYIERMKPGQEELFYLCGDAVESMKASPQLEGFVARGLEVLLMTDHVDDFWLNVVQEYKGKKFKAVTRSDISLERFPRIQDDQETVPPAAPEDQVAALCTRIQSVLGDHVREVRSTDKLGSSAVCLATQEGAMDFRFERFLVEQKQLASASAKILEINPSHPIIRSLASHAAHASEDIIWLLFDQARIVEGEPVLNAADFTRRLQSFVSKAL